MKRALILPILIAGLTACSTAPGVGPTQTEAICQSNVLGQERSLNRLVSGAASTGEEFLAFLQPEAEGYVGIGGNLQYVETYKAKTTAQIEKLDVASSVSLELLKNQCTLLQQCFQNRADSSTGPANACPTEYNNYIDTNNRVLTLVATSKDLLNSLGAAKNDAVSGVPLSSSGPRSTLAYTQLSNDLDKVDRVLSEIVLVPVEEAESTS